MTVINTNTAALRAQNASRLGTDMQQTATERLSTGKRINSAQDDAAGLAISTSMTAQIRGMNQGIRNANDGISLVQTADGALAEVTNTMQRIRELAVQSKSGTYSTDDRANIQSEVTELAAQAKSIVTDSKFNGVALFNSTATASTSGQAFTIQVGANSGDTVAIGLPQVNVTNFVGTTGKMNVSSSTEAEADQHRPCRARRFAEPAGIDHQRQVEHRHQPVRRAQPHRGYGLFDRIDQPRQGRHPGAGVQRDAGAGQPVAAGRAEPPALSPSPSGGRQAPASLPAPGPSCVLI
jgi:flagellin-like hook-associated protein FlgL